MPPCPDVSPTSFFSNSFTFSLNNCSTLVSAMQLTDALYSRSLNGAELYLLHYPQNAFIFLLLICASNARGPSPTPYVGRG
jgi:hypothetical protein